MWGKLWQAVFSETVLFRAVFGDWLLSNEMESNIVNMCAFLMQNFRLTVFAILFYNIRRSQVTFRVT